jgi:hypothetical protein
METLIIISAILIVGLIFLKKLTPTKYEEFKLYLQNWFK